MPDLSAGNIADFYSAFRPGRLVEVGNVHFSTGGPVANTGLALNRLGINAQLMGKVGADLYGDEIRHLVQEHAPHLAQGMVVDANADTSYTVVINPPKVDRIFLHFPGANNTFCAADVDYEIVARSRVFHLGYPPIMRSLYENDGAELAEIFRRAKETGVTTSLDMSLPDASTASGRADWTTILSRTLPYVDVFLPSAEEIFFMLRREAFERMAASGGVLDQVTPPLLSEVSGQMLEMGCAMAIIKLGHRGFYLRTGSAERLASMGRIAADAAVWANVEIWAPAFRVEEVGATGSGDASIAGFLASLLRGLSPAETVVMATAVGACNVEAADGLSGIRPWDATRERIAAGWPKHDLVIDAPGWHFDETTKLWFGPA
ncbi:MAG: carbohydrate kinase family protein [Caldilineales bacterium]|nr:carbohydrate kinase family protein [Caldilineales bacterium]